MGVPLEVNLLTDIKHKDNGSRMQQNGADSRTAAAAAAAAAAVVAAAAAAQQQRRRKRQQIHNGKTWFRQCQAWAKERRARLLMVAVHWASTCLRRTQECHTLKS